MVHWWVLVHCGRWQDAKHPLWALWMSIWRPVQHPHGSATGFESCLNSIPCRKTPYRIHSMHIPWRRVPWSCPVVSCPSWFFSSQNRVRCWQCRVNPNLRSKTSGLLTEWLCPLWHSKYKIMPDGARWSPSASPNLVKPAPWRALHGEKTTGFFLK
jgi:hypothetical protein